MIYLFHSFDFLAFFLITLAVYWSIPHTHRNKVLLLASYIFYASWDYRFLALLVASTWIEYMLGIRVHEAESHSKRRNYLALSVLFNISLLVFFKYFNFFIQDFEVLLQYFGLRPNFSTLQIILPLGISFYTFQKMSYTIDVYRRKIEPSRSLIDFSLYVSYFPQLLAGPIMKARDLLPQIQGKKSLSTVPWKEGIYLYAYGAFQKVVIADTLGILVDSVYTNPTPSGAQILLATYAFMIQIYCDFAGYCNMATGISHFFGIRLSTNFNLPYFSKDMHDLFHRLHMTLTSWIREYVYMPLFFYLIPKLKHLHVKTLSSAYRITYVIGTVITVTIFGIWHGAGWNYLAMGLYLSLAILVTDVLKVATVRILPPVKNGLLLLLGRIFQTVLTFHLIGYADLLLRSEGLAHAIALTGTLVHGIEPSELINPFFWNMYTAAFILFSYELLQYAKRDQLWLPKQSFYVQATFYTILIILFLWMGAVHENKYIYFQF